MTILLSLGTLSVLCAAVAAGAGAASAAPMGVDRLQRGSLSPDVLRVVDPDQRAHDRGLSQVRKRYHHRHHVHHVHHVRHVRHMRHMRARGRR